MWALSRCRNSSTPPPPSAKQCSPSSGPWRSSSATSSVSGCGLASGVRGCRWGRLRVGWGAAARRCADCSVPRAARMRTTRGPRRRRRAGGPRPNEPRHRECTAARRRTGCGGLNRARYPRGAHRGARRGAGGRSGAVSDPPHVGSRHGGQSRRPRRPPACRVGHNAVRARTGGRPAAASVGPDKEDGMIAAIYARKSTEQTGVNEEDRSVTRQIAHARAYAEGKGWRVVEEHVYVDDGISGAEFKHRPGLIRLLNALQPTPAFQVVVMSETSRVGREQARTQLAFSQIAEAGVEMWAYLDDKRWALDTATDKFMLSVANFTAELEREKASQRTYDAMV